MISRIKDYNNPPPGLIDPKWDELKNKLLIEKSRHEFKVECYRDTTIEQLCNLYEDKCAMCERKRGTELQVDHYRPKKPRVNGALDFRHEGYYWLAYTWSNLIPLCSKCNIKKGTKFHLRNYDNNKRVNFINTGNYQTQLQFYDSSWLNSKEEPLLLNPEIEKRPFNHLRFLPNGRMEGKSPEGIETIDICDLNRRDLFRERKKIINGYVQEIRSAIDDFEKSSSPNKDIELKAEIKSTFKRILNGTESDEPFSLLHIFIQKYFDQFIAVQIGQQFRNKINQYFQDFLGN